MRHAIHYTQLNQTPIPPGVKLKHSVVDGFFELKSWPPGTTAKEIKDTFARMGKSFVLIHPYNA